MSGSEKPKLRKLRRRNYHNINRGLPENPETMDDDIVEALDSPHSAPGSPGKTPDKLTEVSESSDTDDGELTRMKEEMSKLKKEEEKLKKRTELQSMRKRLQEQREKVQNLRGTIHTFDISSDKLSKKTNKKSPVQGQPEDQWSCKRSPDILA